MPASENIIAARQKASHGWVRDRPDRSSIVSNITSRRRSDRMIAKVPSVIAR